jgi:hypothetical protein
MWLNESQQQEDLLSEWLRGWIVLRIEGKWILMCKEIADGWTSILWIQDVQFTNDHSIHVTEVSDKTIRFFVKREWDVDKEFTFSKLIFVQRFRLLTDLENIVDIAPQKDNISNEQVYETAQMVEKLM